MRPLLLTTPDVAAPFHHAAASFGMELLVGTNPHELSSVLDGHLGSVGAVLGSDAETAGRVTVDGVTVSNEVRGQGWSQRKFADNVKEIAD